MKLLKLLKQFHKDEKGIETIELALMAALIAVASIGAATLVGENVSSTFSYVASTLSSAVP